MRKKLIFTKERKEVEKKIRGYGVKEMADERKK